MDVFAVYEAAEAAIAHARTGNGPTLLECKTYRYYGHFEGDSMKYRTKQEVQSYRDRDPLEQFCERVLADGVFTKPELAAIEQKAEAIMEHAGAFAEKSPMPEPQECLDDVYVSYS
jgi:pyruvate dehydrogenase E1 component alpha subunit